MALILLSADASVLRANRAVENWGLGPVETATGKPIHDLLHPGCDDDECQLAHLLKLHLADPGVARRHEKELRDSRLNRSIHVVVEPLGAKAWRGMSVDVPKPHFLVAVSDMTELERHRLQQGRRTRFETVHLVARKLAHEVANPLAAMRATIEVLSQNIEDFEADKVSQYLSRILEGTDRLQSIVERNLNEHQLPDLSSSDVRVLDLLQRMYRLFDDDMRARGLRLRMPVVASDLTIRADLTAIEEVMMNVLRNAMDATPAGGQIDVECSSADGRVEVVIRDNGRGMNGFQLSHVFEPFVTTKDGGSGLGLVYSRYLMNKMRGTISIESEVERGTTVRLRCEPGGEHVGR